MGALFEARWRAWRAAWARGGPRGEDLLIIETCRCDTELVAYTRVAFGITPPRAASGAPMQQRRMGTYHPPPREDTNQHP